MNSRAWYVTQYGFADYANVYNVSISYGSPGTDWNDCCYYVNSFGILFPRYGNSVEDDPDNSYGK